MTPRLIILLLGTSLTAPLFAQSTDVAPDLLVRKITENTLAIVHSDSNTHADNHKGMAQFVEKNVLPYFAFGRMARLAMGNEWGDANPQQQQMLISEFRTLLINTYASVFMNYKDQTVDVAPLQMAPGDTDVVVRTLVDQQNGQPMLSIDYYMEKTPNGWKAYDFSVNGVRWVLNYRVTFINEIRSNGIDGLIKALQNKNRPLA